MDLGRDVDEVVARLDAHTLPVTIHRPAKKKALYDRVCTCMAQLLEMADASSEGRVMVLGGTQDGLSSGNDVSTFTSVPLAARRRSAHGDRKLRICMLYARAAV
ncbi:MAG: hypothetical protein NXI15_16250 [Gammaproteobacteria bacterium]|nr:hypothetical protein [Gammaproteobacteria bacterium]